MWIMQDNTNVYGIMASMKVKENINQGRMAFWTTATRAEWELHFVNIIKRETLEHHGAKFIMVYNTSSCSAVLLGLAFLRTASAI